MTVVFSLRCSDGLVLAADSQATERDRGVVYPVNKIHPLGERGAWGGSGSRAVLLDLGARLDATAEAVLDAGHLGHALQEQIRPVLTHHYEAYIEEVPGAASSSDQPTVHVLTAAHDRDGQPWIVEVDPHCSLRRYEDIGYHAIGTGGPMAMQAGTLLSHFGARRQPLEYGLVIAMRVLDQVAEISDSVGGAPNLWRITPEGAEQVDDDEIPVLRGTVERWKKFEQSSLEEVFEQRGS